MNKVSIKVENLSKLYRLGEVGTGTISHDLNRWWARVRGKEDPFAKVGTVNDRTQKAQKGEHVWALKDIDFEVRQGEVLGIIGKNGAGKSTLLKLLSKITAPTTGSIKARGRIASLLEVGTGMHPEMTGIENVYLNGTILGMTRAEIKAKLDDILDFAGCTKYGDTPVKRYSSGMKVRLGFAVAAFLEPEILIVDEVLAVGDAEFQKRAIGKMQEVSQGGGRTVLFVSHNMASVKQLCTKAILMEHGEVSFSGNVDDTVDYYSQSVITNLNESLEKRDVSRKGNGLIKIERFYISNLEGKIVEKALSGETVVFNFVLKSEMKNLKAVDLGFSIHDKYNNRLAVLYSSFQDFVFETGQSENIHLKCKIDNFPFQQDIYKVAAQVKIGSELADWPVGGLGTVEVENGNFYGTGRSGSVTNAPILIKGEWNILSEKDKVLS
jgi:lipopolysaccharide transport system ATP-binding protein